MFVVVKVFHTFNPMPVLQISGSGDQTARLWDVERQKCKAVLRGHSCSVKALACNHKDTSK